jgi:uncharacterized membrane protein YgcG
MRSKLLILFLLSVACLSSCARFSKQTVKTESTPQPQATPQATGEFSITTGTSRFPAPTGLVNDYANVISHEARTRLVALLTNLKTEANIEFAIVTVDTTNGEPIFDYSLALAREWGVGSKDTATGGGIVLLLAVKDREWRLQVSRSLEKDLPDEVCKELGEKSTPLYRKGDYAGGIEEYVSSIIKQLEKTRSRSRF